MIVADIAAAAGVITALSLLVTSFTLLVPILRTTRITHELVNQSHTDLIRYQAALVRALKGAGVDVPVDQSKEQET